MRKFILNIALFLIPIVIAIPVVNTFVDSGFVVNDRSNKVAQILVSGLNAGIKTIPSNWESLQLNIVAERIKQKDIVPKNIMLLGTSRSSEIRADFFQGKTFFNCALPGGNILDYIALFSLYKQNNLLPAYMIISIDPWTFHARKAVTINKKIEHLADSTLSLKPGRLLLDYYYAGMKSLELTDTTDVRSDKVSKIKILPELLSLNYFQTNMSSITDELIIASHESVVNKYFTIRSDGGYTLARKSQIDSTSVTKASHEFNKINAANFFLSSDTVSRYWKYFETLLFYMKQNGIVPIIYISPINPIVFDGLSNSSEIPLEYKIDEFCEKNRIVKVGSFSPYKYGYERVSNNFMDEYHPVSSVVGDIFDYHRKELDSIGIALSRDLKSVK